MTLDPNPITAGANTSIAVADLADELGTYRATIAFVNEIWPPCDTEIWPPCG
jgi:hypothetical protein